MLTLVNCVSDGIQERSKDGQGRFCCWPGCLTQDKCLCLLPVIFGHLYNVCVHACRYLVIVIFSPVCPTKSEHCQSSILVLYTEHVLSQQQGSLSSWYTEVIFLLLRQKLYISAVLSESWCACLECAKMLFVCCYTC